MATPTWEKMGRQSAAKQAIQPLLKFLMTTEVEGREGGAEKAAEWDEKVDQEGEELRHSR